MKWALFISVCLILGIAFVNGDEGYFWHVTDFHYDPTYSKSSLSCDKEKVEGQLGPYGDMWCDAPWRLVESSVQAMKRLKSDVDFLIWTGDTVLHAEVEKLNHTFNAAILDNTTDILETTFAGIPVYASFGNHDSYPTGQFPPNNTLLYNESLARWRSWINDETQENNFRKGGFYTVKTTYGIRIVALNTILYYTPNKEVLAEGDPAGQFAWLIQTLDKARKQNEKVIVTAHIAPGVTPKPDIPLYTKQNERLVEILRDFADVIVAMHFGHEHSDAFKVLKNNAGVPTSPVFLAPSIAPLRFGPMHNPGIRLVKYDRATGKHLDITQYYLDLYAANEAGDAAWTLEYSTSSVYNLQELTALKLYELIEKMKNADSKDFKNYKKFYYVSPPERLTEKCDWKCHAVTWCAFTEFTLDDVEKCVQGMVSGALRVTSLFGFILFVSVFRSWLVCNENYPM